MFQDFFVTCAIFVVCVGPHAIVLGLQKYQDNHCPMYDPRKKLRKPEGAWTKPLSPI